MPMQLETIYQGQTLVLGHRGASAYAPMNTLPAFVLAADQGADGIELDVHLTRDGQLIVLHDFTVDHTTDGHGLACEMTLADIKQLDAGGWFDESFRGTHIPTLDEVFEAVGQRFRLINVEIKSESQEKTDGVEQAVADAILRFNLAQRIIVSSFNPFALRRFRMILPAVAIGYLYAPDGPDTQHIMAEVPHEARHPHYSLIDEHFVAWAHAEGYRVNTWTVNDPDAARMLHRLGVDAVMTDYPDRIVEALRG